MVGYKTPRYLKFGWCGARLGRSDEFHSRPDHMAFTLAFVVVASWMFRGEKHSRRVATTRDSSRTKLRMERSGDCGRHPTSIAGSHLGKGRRWLPMSGSVTLQIRQRGVVPTFLALRSLTVPLECWRRLLRYCWQHNGFDGLFCSMSFSWCSQVPQEGLIGKLVKSQRGPATVTRYAVS